MNFSGVARFLVLRVKPGATALTRTPCGPYFTAKDFVMELIPAFAAE
jgi:hypothetical protein